MAAVSIILLVMFLADRHYDALSMPSTTADNAALPDIDSESESVTQTEATKVVITYDPLSGLFAGNGIDSDNQPLYAEYIDTASAARTVFIGLPGAQQVPSVSATDQNGNALPVQWMPYEGQNWLTFDRLITGSVTVTYDLTTPKGCQPNEQCYAA